MRSGDDERRRPAATANSLAVTLTLTGKLATPYGSVVELRLEGVSDGYGTTCRPSAWSSGVEDVAPTFELETTTIAVLPNRAVFSLPVDAVL